VARVPIHDLQTAPEDSRPALERQSQRMGRIINIFGAMANAPVLIEMYDRVEALLASGSSLGEPVRQAIHLTVAAVNDCDYCQAAYTGAARRTGFSVEETVQIRAGEVADRPDLNVILSLAREMADHRGHVDDATWAAATDAGVDERQILEIYAEVVRTILTNYFNHLVDTELDLPPAPEAGSR
jgi:AhpD family alkylhydroperoxidase